MPDWLVIVVAIVSITACFVLSTEYRTGKSLAALAVFLALCAWFAVAWTFDWGPPVDGFDQPVKEFKHADGSVTQYLDGLDSEKSRENTMKDRFYPAGTVIHTEVYSPWVGGIRWSVHQKRVPILPKH